MTLPVAYLQPLKDLESNVDTLGFPALCQAGHYQGIILMDIS